MKKHEINFLHTATIEHLQDKIPCCYGGALTFGEKALVTMVNRGGQAPAHRHQRGIRAGAEADRGKEAADGEMQEEQGRLFGGPLAQEDEVPLWPRLRKDQVAYQDGLHHLYL